ncbi:MAG: hypothetical protein V1784_01050 [bacterium]
MSRYEALDLSGVTTYPMEKRTSKVERDRFSKSPGEVASFRAFWNSLPDFLAAAELRQFVGHVLAARGKQPIIWMMGAHPLKVGLSPLLIHLAENGFISILSSHGAFAVHDVEIALFGCTSEDVGDAMKDGRFGMTRETGEFFVRVSQNMASKDIGLGEALGEELVRQKAPYAKDSLLVRCLEMNIPLTIHVAIGTDIFFEHPGLDAATLGRLSYYDFRIFAQKVAELRQGGIVMDIGSAVVMPEVFLKALSVARNLGYPCHGFYTANFDMIQHYRPWMNVVRRPTLTGGKGYQFVGHHEIMIPLLAAALQASQTNSDPSSS